ncbi:O-methyltransferase [Penicillium taxi]|uniref:O-methyltransferase n=1 Tax=Penicillium taxi TaxID=168475 RepID=UPI002544FDBE|nr:O-methyltransferase [Penicillium taxi]KAJ5902875.1 O-methyltransferase [Penicillium taxi]
MAPTSVSEILNGIASARVSFDKNEAGSREALIDYSRSLISSLEIPSEFLQRTFWAEPAQSAIIRLAVNVKLFQHLQAAGDAGLILSALSEKTGIDVVLLQRFTRHLVAMNLLTFSDGAIHATPLSNGLAAENYQQSICFCYDTSRPSFNNFPDFFKKTEYKPPAPGGTDGPFQDAHSTQLRFFDWLVATPPNLLHFDSFMSAYRAGKPDWFDYYPVAERLIEGFDSSNNEALLVDVGGGRGHDMTTFAKNFPTRPGKIILEDREPVIAAVTAANTELDFDVLAHNFFTPQPIVGARAYSLHSILHDWGDEDSIKIIENLVPALKKGYSRVLFNEIVLSEEKPTLAATNMDMMMLAHFAVRERSEEDWKILLAKGGLKVVKIYTSPGVAESLIEAELA